LLEEQSCQILFRSNVKQWSLGLFEEKKKEQTEQQQDE